MWMLVAAAVAGCDPKMADRGVKAVKSAEAAMRVEIAAVSVGASCRGTPLGENASQLGNLQPDMRPTFDLRTAAESPELWMEVCGGTAGIRILADLPSLPVEERRAHLWSQCDLGRFDWMSEKEWLSADGLLVTPFSAGVLLGQHEVKPASTKVLVRGLAGLNP
ncbi:MAG: hypothetical protein R3F61_31535 [Myxococcota bacterium]